MAKRSSLDFKIYSPSYRRAKVATTHKLFEPKNFCYVIRAEEEPLYKNLGVELILIPKGKVSNISETRNWILDNRKSEQVVMIDDDMQSINWMIGRQLKKLSAPELTHVIANGFQMAIDSNCGMWGMNCVHDPKAYRVFSPLSFGLIILGPFSAFVDTSLRYDPRLTLKEDYDMFLQQIHKHRRVLRFNYLNYICDHFTLEGGCQTYRDPEKERLQNGLLKQKWGDVIRDNFINKNSVNMIVKTGL